jgi:hypothetical protein
MRAHVLALGLFAAASAGCTAGKVFVASAGDYADYRATRVSPTFEGRVGAAARYLERRPRGAYADEVRAYFDRAELLFYESSAKNAEGLESYLDVLPKGPHAAEARDALAFFGERAAKPDELLVAAAATRRRLEANARGRAHAREELSSWLERVMAKGVYTAPLGDAPKELLVPYTLSLPAPRCATFDPPKAGIARRCDKTLDLPYVIPVKRKWEDRELVFSVTLEMDAHDVPVRAAVSGPDLFARLEETWRKDAVDRDDLSSRIDAVERAVDVVGGAFEAQVSVAPDCQREVAAPDVVHLACAGIDVVATLGGGDDGDDVVVVTPTR